MCFNSPHRRPSSGLLLWFHAVSLPKYSQELGDVRKRRVGSHGVGGGESISPAGAVFCASSLLRFSADSFFSLFFFQREGVSRC